jgi:hypothetical protein
MPFQPSRPQRIRCRLRLSFEKSRSCLRSVCSVHRAYTLHFLTHEPRFERVLTRPVENLVWVVRIFYNILRSPICVWFLLQFTGRYLKNSLPKKLFKCVLQKGVELQVSRKTCSCDFICEAFYSSRWRNGGARSANARTSHS